MTQLNNGPETGERSPGDGSGKGSLCVRDMNSGFGPVCVNVTISSKLKSLSIEQVTPGSIVAGGASVPFKVLLTPEDAAAQIKWSVNSKCSGRVDITNGKFTPGAKTGKCTITAQDTLSKVPPAQATISVNAKDPGKYETCDIEDNLTRANRRCTYLCFLIKGPQYWDPLPPWDIRKCPKQIQVELP